MSKETNHNNPWLDIASYSINDTNRFKGREKAIVKFSGIVNSGIMSVLYANSGIGKTSFLNAGIDPLMIQKGYFPIHIVFPDEIFSSSHAIEKWLIESLHAKATKNGKSWENILEQTDEEKRRTKDILEQCSTSLWWMLHTCSLVDREGKQYLPLLVFDQFEEVFVKSRKFGNTAIESELFQLLEELSNSSFPSSIAKILEKLADLDIFLPINHAANYKVIFSLRKEYLSDFDYWTQDRFSISELQQNRMLLLPLTRKQALRVITEQPAIDGEGYVQTLNSVQQQIIDKLDPKQRNEVEPFLLSVLCSRLYDMALSENKSALDPIDLQTYNVDTIIRSFYEEKISEIIVNSHHLARFENLLVDEDGFRNRTKVKELRSIGFERNYQDNLLQAHLIRVDSYNNNNDEKFIELIHDRIADAIMQRRKSKNLKRTRALKVLASIAALLGMISITAWRAVNNQSSYLSYMPSKIIVTKYKYEYPLEYKDTNIKKVIIDSYHKTKDRYGNYQTWLPLFKGCTNLECIEFRNGIYDVPYEMFKGCSSLSKVVLRNATLRTIGRESFYQCQNLSVIDLSQTTTLGREAFSYCRSLRTIQLADSLRKIPDGCFYSCENLEHVGLGTMTSDIGEWAFCKCTNLRSLDISKVTNIERCAFQSCQNLDTICFSDSIIELQDYILESTNVSYVVIGSSISKIDHSAFKDTKHPIEFIIRKNPYYTATKDLLIDLRDSSVVYTDISKEDKNQKCVYREFPNILDKTKSYRYQYDRYSWDTILICDVSKQLKPNIVYLFDAKQKIIHIDDTLKFYGKFRISRYDSYINYIQKKEIKIIDLSNCNSLYIESQAFENCTYIEHIIWPDSIVAIKKEAFKNCINLKEVDFRKVFLTSLEENAFVNCTNLSFVNMGDVETQKNSFKDCVIDTLFGYNGYYNTIIHNMVLPDTINENKLYFKGWCPNTHFLFSDTSRFFFDKSHCLWYRYKHPKTEYNNTVQKSALVHAILLAFGADVTQLIDDTLYSTFYECEGIEKVYDVVNGVLMQGNHVKCLLSDKSYVVHDSAFFNADTLGKRDILNVKIKNPAHYHRYMNFLFSTKEDAYIWRLNDDSIVYVSPSCSTEKIYHCAFNPNLLQEIHVPFTSPIFKINMNDSAMSKISVYVPYGTKDKFLEDNYYKKFKEIKEDHYLCQLWNVFYYYYVAAKGFFKSFMWLLYVLVGGILLTVSLLVYIGNSQYQRQIAYKKAIHTFFATLGFTVITFLIWVSVYYFIWLGLCTFDQLLASILASLASLGFIVFLIYWINKNNIFDLNGIDNKIRDFIWTYLK